MRTPESRLRWIARVCKVATAPFVRYDVRGGACAPDLEVGIVAANHRSLFDVVAGVIALHHFRRYVRVLIAREYFDKRLMGLLCRAIGAIPVDRRDSGHALDAAVQALKSGIPLLIMPEGKLHWDPDQPLTTGRAKTGISRLAIAADVPVLPAGLVGTQHVWPAGRPLPRMNPFRRRRVVVVNVADEPMWLQGDDHAANAEAVMAEIRRLMADGEAILESGSARP
ncbi:MAG: 1-acyl-sn-glycerol-3-phosphate acyltransferase [Acidimicrobiales bacterium]|nr:1-acyl-sn-glycerol-3-phosphate acyltransferase [Acidimicrobiales bacterium]